MGPIVAVLVWATTASGAAAQAAQAGAPAMRPAPATHVGADTFKRLYDFGLGKRASYVAEYKRLPMYNFGIGKRAGGATGAGPGALRPMGAAPPGMYAFGLGKRADEDPDMDDDLDISQVGENKRFLFFFFFLLGFLARKTSDSGSVLLT